jgi:hypothetical protein
MREYYGIGKLRLAWIGGNLEKKILGVKRNANLLCSAVLGLHDDAMHVLDSQQPGHMIMHI